MEKEVQEEAQHFVEVYSAFRNYGKHSIRNITTRALDLQRVSSEHHALLVQVGYVDRLKRVKDAVLKNHEFLKRVIQSAELFFNPVIEEKLKADVEEEVSEMNKDKVRSTIKQIMRDWSAEGAQERIECYTLILETLKAYFPVEDGRQSIKVLTPGAGLGRLAWEIANLGFYSQGNEFSYFMLITSNFILNNLSENERFEMFPFVHQSNNLVSGLDQVRSVQVPDVYPGSLSSVGNLSMTAGEFMEVYSEDKDQWDVVVTAFFLDTAKNVLDYMQVISKILKKGGLWINLGPLLYHYSDSLGEISIELSYEELKKLFVEFGLSLLEEEVGVRCHYTLNDRSMLEMTYRCVRFVCRRQ